MRGPYRVYTPRTVRRCVEAVRAGEAIMTVAEREGVPYSSLNGWCARHGVRGQGTGGWAVRRARQSERDACQHPDARRAT